MKASVIYMKITVKGGIISDVEKDAYAAYVRKHYPKNEVSELVVNLDGDYVDLEVKFKGNQPFERIRRVTGYLSTDYRRFNNGKRAEVQDRISHDI